jgi:Uma2 family endonuclease
MGQPLRKHPPDWEVPSGEPDPFRYGTRLRRVRLPGGETAVQEIPLTAEDLLDPQPGDEVTQSDPHFELFLLLGDMLRRFYDDRDDVFVAGDLKMLWGIPGLPGPAPDIAVIPGVSRKRDPRRTAFDVVQEGARPCLILEVVSSADAETRRNDYEKKVRIYKQVGIPEYLILDPPAPATKGRLLLTGYRLGAGGRYQQILPDGEGRLLSETTGLLFGTDEEGSILILDTRTGERLLTSRQEMVARKAAEAELIRLRAELEQARRKS